MLLYHKVKVESYLFIHLGKASKIRNTNLIGNFQLGWWVVSNLKNKEKDMVYLQSESSKMSVKITFFLFSFFQLGGGLVEKPIGKIPIR